MQSDWVIVYATKELHLAEIARQICQDHGIEAVVMNKMDSNYLAFGDIEVMVKNENQAAAENLLANLEAPGNGS